MAVQFVQPHQFTPEQYLRMLNARIVPHASAELVDGVVVVGMRPYRFSDEDYARLGEAGILDEDERVELVDGEIIQMTPIGARHSTVVSRVAQLLFRLRGSREVRTQDVLLLREGFQPHPDAVLYRAPTEAYALTHPRAEDALLVVEVADTSLLYDRTLKAEHYAAAGIPEYWLVDLKRDVVLVMRQPAASAYLDVREYRHGESWTSPALDGTEVEAATVLGPPRT
ncbi:MAG TPA: Uma2 family endonuclease [Longimicrobiaceae bacterium]|nr:Uma2 family endonuclease [Longimicrobiaceae bacterium]